MPTGKRSPVKVILPEGPPELTPAAARTLLKILLKAYEEQAANESRPGTKPDRAAAANGPSGT
jgi:hypothetical protein